MNLIRGSEKVFVLNQENTVWWIPWFELGTFVGRGPSGFSVLECFAHLLRKWLGSWGIEGDPVIFRGTKQDKIPLLTNWKWIGKCLQRKEKTGAKTFGYFWSSKVSNKKSVGYYLKGSKFLRVKSNFFRKVNFPRTSVFKQKTDNTKLLRFKFKYLVIFINRKDYGLFRHWFNGRTFLFCYSGI